MNTCKKIWTLTAAIIVSTFSAIAEAPSYYATINENGYGSGYNICYRLKPDTVGGIIYTPIDMGSGVAWADRNIGAQTPADGGTCFYWGDVSGKEQFSESNYYPDVKHLVANTTILAPEYDAAHVLLGEHWRMPTKQEIGMLNNFAFDAPPGTGGVQSDYNIEQTYEEGVGLTCTYINDPERNILIPETYWYSPNKSNTKKACFWTSIIGNQVNQFNNQQYSSAINFTYSTSFNQGTYSASNIYYGMPIRPVYQPTCEVCTLTVLVKATGTYCIFYNNDGSCLEEENGTMIYIYKYICEKGQEVTVYPMRNDGNAGCGWLESDGKTAVKNNPNVDLENNVFTVSSDMTFYADFSTNGGVDGEDGGSGNDEGDNNDLGSVASFTFDDDNISATTRYCTNQSTYWNGEDFVIITAYHNQTGDNSYFNIGFRTQSTQDYNGYTGPVEGTYYIEMPEYYKDEYYGYVLEEYYYYDHNNDVVPPYIEVCAATYGYNCTSYAPITQCLFLSDHNLSGQYIDVAPYNDLSNASYVVVREGKDGYFFLQVCDASGNVLVSVGEPKEKTQYTITINPTTNGSITVKNGLTQLYNGQGGGTLSIEEGTTLTLTATPITGYQFNGWTNDAANTVSVNADKTLGATFNKVTTHDVILYEGIDCSISFSDGSKTYQEYSHTYSFAEGTTLTFTISPTDSLYDYGEFLDEDLNTLHEGLTWTINLTEDMALMGYASIGEFLLEDILPNDTYYSQTIPWGKSVHKVTLKRDFQAKQWNTLCLPFEANITPAQTGIFYTIENAKLQNTQLTVNFSKVSYLNAGMPYLLYSRTAVSKPTWEYVVFPNSPIAAGSYTEDAGILTYHGVLNNAVSLPANDKYYRYLENNTINYPNSKGTTIAHGRAFFRITDGLLPSKSPRLIFTIDDETTIEETPEEVQTTKFMEDGVLYIERNGTIYNAQGAVVR